VVAGVFDAQSAQDLALWVGAEGGLSRPGGDVRGMKWRF
jgi:hypothetical protein